MKSSKATAVAMNEVLADRVNNSPDKVKKSKPPVNRYRIALKAVRDSFAVFGRTIHREILEDKEAIDIIRRMESLEEQISLLEDERRDKEKKLAGLVRKHVEKFINSESEY